MTVVSANRRERSSVRTLSSLWTASDKPLFFPLQEAQAQYAGPRPRPPPPAVADGTQRLPPQHRPQERPAAADAAAPAQVLQRVKHEIDPDTADGPLHDRLDLVDIAALARRPRRRQHDERHAERYDARVDDLSPRPPVGEAL